MTSSVRESSKLMVVVDYNHKVRIYREHGCDDVRRVLVLDSKALNDLIYDLSSARHAIAMNAYNPDEGR